MPLKDDIAISDGIFTSTSTYFAPIVGEAKRLLNRTVALTGIVPLDVAFPYTAKAKQKQMQVTPWERARYFEVV
jgi:hypothetical protein